MPQLTSDAYTFKIQKNNPHIDIKDLEAWISNEVKGKWSKRKLKHSIVYTFTTTNDAFAFKMRWTFS